MGERNNYFWMIESEQLLNRGQNFNCRIFSLAAQICLLCRRRYGCKTYFAGARILNKTFSEAARFFPNPACPNSKITFKHRLSHQPQLKSRLSPLTSITTFRNPSTFVNPHHSSPSFTIHHHRSLSITSTTYLEYHHRYYSK